MIWEDDEYCLLVNAKEGSPLWSLLADWSDTEDEEEWRRHIPRFSSLIAHWHRAGYVRLFQGEDWATGPDAQEVTAADVPGLLADPDTWAWRDFSERVTIVALTEREITGPPPN